jgi:hypothetical protein
VSWLYSFSRHAAQGIAQPCQDAKCSQARAVYRLTAKDGSKTAHRDLCVNHAAASAYRLGLPFPPVLGKGK